MVAKANDDRRTEVPSVHRKESPMPASTPESVMMHVPVSRLDIVYGPAWSQWMSIKDLVNENGFHETTFTLRSGAAPHTFRRKLRIISVDIELGRVWFKVAYEEVELQGTVVTRTRKGYIIT